MYISILQGGANQQPADRRAGEAVALHSARAHRAEDQAHSKYTLLITSSYLYFMTQALVPDKTTVIPLTYQRTVLDEISNTDFLTHFCICNRFSSSGTATSCHVESEGCRF